jgi:glutamate synthase (ferredoxin)
VHVKGSGHGIVEQALKVLINLLHRGACGCEANTGDGAGILLQMPDRFFRRESNRLGFTLPPERQYGAGFVFLQRDPELRAQIEARFEAIVADEGQRVLGWRDVPTDDALVGPSAVAVEPVFRQLFIGRGPALESAADQGAEPEGAKLYDPQAHRARGGRHGAAGSQRVLRSQPSSKTISGRAC